MDRTEIRAALQGLFAAAPEAGAYLDAALDATRLADSAERPPSHPNWEPTWDLYLSAADVAERLHMASLVGAASRGPDLAKFTSEGATFEYADATTWADVATRFWARSRAGQAGGAFALIGLPSPPRRAAPRSAGGRRC